MSTEDELLHQARSVLRQGRRELDPATAVAMRRSLDERIGAKDRPPFRLRFILPLAAAAACAAVVFVARIDEDPVRVVSGNAIELDRSLIASKGAEVEIHHTKVVALQNARMLLGKLGPDEVRLDLIAGEVELEVDPSVQSFVVTTPLAKIEVVATRFSVMVDEDRTDVHVFAGAAEVTELSSGQTVHLTAGQIHSVERPRVAEVVEAHEEIAEAVQKPADEPRPAPRPRHRRHAPAVKQPEPKEEPAVREEIPASPQTHRREAAGGRAVKGIPLPPPEPAKVIEEDPTPVIPPGEAPRSAPEQKAEKKAEPEVVEAPPSVEELVRRADRFRRAKHYAEAVVLYSQIANHDFGEPFAEEALFRKAELSVRLGDLQAGLQALGDADRRFGHGELAPERAALAARIHLHRGDPIAASRALAGVENERSTLELTMVALDVAKALEQEHPCDALRMLTLVHKPEELRARADEIAARVVTRCPKSP